MSDGVKHLFPVGIVTDLECEVLDINVKYTMPNDPNETISKMNNTKYNDLTNENKQTSNDGCMYILRQSDQD